MQRPTLTSRSTGSSVSRERFADLIQRQLDLFEREQAALIADCEHAERAYDAADREDAEERYSEYLDLVETGTDLLADLRDNFAMTMDEEAAEEYEQAFNRAVAGAAATLRARDRKLILSDGLGALSRRSRCRPARPTSPCSGSCPRTCRRGC